MKETPNHINEATEALAAFHAARKTLIEVLAEVESQIAHAEEVRRSMKDALSLTNESEELSPVLTDPKARPTAEELMEAEDVVQRIDTEDEEAAETHIDEEIDEALDDPEIDNPHHTAPDDDLSNLDKIYF